MYTISEFYENCRSLSSDNSSCIFISYNIACDMWRYIAYAILLLFVILILYTVILCSGDKST